MATFYKQTPPTGSDNVSAGYPVDSIWVNEITYVRYKHESDGVWSHDAVNSGMFFVPTETSKKLN